MRDESFFRRPTDPQDHPGLTEALESLREREAAGLLPHPGYAPETLSRPGRLIREELHLAAGEDRRP